MAAYKLYYFPMRARGELVRLMFAAADVKYEDIRIPFADWPNQKLKFPFRQVPVLEVDGKQLCDSYAIARYLANEYGLCGQTKWEVAEADMYTGAVEDIFSIVAHKIYLEKDPEIKANALKKFKQETGPNLLQAFEAALVKNSSGYLVGNELTYADLAFLHIYEYMEGALKSDASELISNFPNIQEHLQKIRSLPKIAAWINKRPISDR